MIVADRKPIEQIETMIEGMEKVLIVGCGTCVAVCMAGGEKEVELLAAQLRMKGKLDGKTRTIDEITITRQCDNEYLDGLAKHIDQYDAVLSLGCGAGVQFLAERYDDKVVLPGLNTLFIGVAEEAGVWSQKCMACSECVLDQTGGICPMTICAKNLLNGPCGGTDHGKCEVDGEKDCAWTLIYRKLEKLGRLEDFEKIQPPKDYSVMLKPRKHTHQAFQEAQQEEE
ncbi:MAG: methylenetetrahydrofolate reductase C-terminal domain-containing protein [Planctomycetes bacterium]|nr:methylenetetrahydrofolate reductase C-terminal domain-containing protein [Planctomycetota bacterium]